MATALQVSHDVRCLVGVALPGALAIGWKAVKQLGHCAAPVQVNCVKVMCAYVHVLLLRAAPACPSRYPPSPPVPVPVALQVPSEDSLPSGPGWESFLAQLDSCGQLATHQPGSPRHAALLQQAALRYGRVLQYRRRAAALAAPALLVQHLLQVRA